MASRAFVRFGFVFAVILSLLSWRIASGAPLDSDLTADSGGYTRMARALRSGEIFSPVKWDNYFDKHVLATRTPGFPALYAAAGSFPYTEARLNLTFVHLLLTAFAGLFFLRCFSSSMDEIAAGVGFACGVWAFRQYAYSVMPEWSCFLLLICLSGVLVQHFDRPSTRRVGLAGVVACLLILSKPVFLIVMPLPFLACSLLPASSRRYGAYTAAVAVLPVFLWMGLNLHRIGEFSLCSYNGYNMFPGARLLGPLPVPESEPGLLDEFIVHLNTFGMSAAARPSRIGLFDRRQATHYSQWMNDFNVNMWDVGTKFALAHKLTPMEINALGRRYTIRAWRNYPVEAFWYWLHGISQLRLSWLPLCAVLIPAAFLIMFGKRRVLATVGFIAAAIHVVQVVSTAVFAATIERYVVLTAAPLWAIAGPLVAAVCVCAVSGLKRTAPPMRTADTFTQPERLHVGEANP